MLWFSLPHATPSLKLLLGDGRVVCFELLRPLPTLDLLLSIFSLDSSHVLLFAAVWNGRTDNTLTRLNHAWHCSTWRCSNTRRRGGIITRAVCKWADFSTGSMRWRRGWLAQTEMIKSFRHKHGRRETGVDWEGRRRDEEGERRREADVDRTNRQQPADCRFQWERHNKDRCASEDTMSHRSSHSYNRMISRRDSRHQSRPTKSDNNN